MTDPNPTPHASSRRKFSSAALGTDHNLEALALWTGYRLGVLDAMIAPASFDGLLDREVDGLLRITKSGYIAGRAGMTTSEVMDQLERERHEAVARMTGIGLISVRSVEKARWGRWGHAIALFPMSARPGHHFAADLATS